MNGSPVLSEYLQLSSARIHHLRAGTQGQQLVLVHGGGPSSAQLCWKPVIESFSCDCRVFAPDLPGFGKSPLGSVRPVCSAFTAVLEQYLAKLKASDSTLVGLSMGGLLALRTVLGGKINIARLVLVNSIGLGSPVPVWPLANLARYLPQIRIPLDWAMLHSDRLLRFGLGYNIHKPERITPQLIREVRAELRRPGGAAAWTAFLASEVRGRRFRSNLREQLGELELPVLFVQSAEDRLVPASWARAAQQRVAGSRLVEVAGCGHWLPREELEKFASILTEFLGT